MRVYVSPFARWLVAIPFGIAAIYTIVPAVFAIPDEPEGHALSHGLPAMVIALVAAGIWRTRAARRDGERLALGALAVLSVAQVLEAVSAFTEYPSSGVLHDATSIASMLAIIGVVAGIVWAVVGAVRGGRLPAWGAVAIAGLLGALFVRMLIGF